MKSGISTTLALCKAKRTASYFLRLVRASFPILVLALSCMPVLAQTNVNEEQGIKAHDSLHGGALDSVSLTNGSVLHHIPLVCFPQRGSLNLCFSVYSNTKNWQLVNYCTADPNDPTGWNCGQFKWEPLPRGGLLPVTNPGIKNPPNYLVDGAYVASSVDYWFQAFSQAEPSDPNNPPPQTLYDWAQSIVSPDGNVHLLATTDGGSASPGPSYPLRSLDATGMLAPDGQTLILPNGTRFSFLNGGAPQADNTAPASVTDANGNQITINSSTGAYTDTMGRVIPAPPGTATSDLSNCPSGTVSANVWTVPGVANVNNGLRTFKFCYSTVSIYTSFGDGSTQYPATNTPLLTAIVLPDLTLWTFSYDHYGDVTQLGLPTGGSISYTYSLAPVVIGSCMVVTSRTVNASDGTGGHTWSYNYSGHLTGNPASYSGSAVVTSPDGNDTVHTIASAVSGTTSPLYDTQVQYYQGSQSTGTLLKTTATQYTGTANPMTPDAPTAIDVVPTQVTTTWPQGHTSKVVTTWDSGNTVNPFGGTPIPVVLGSVLEKDEYNFSNSLARSTLNHYLWQDNSTYLNNNLLAPLVSTTVKDGSGNQVAKTTYGTDQYGSNQPTPSGISTQRVSPPAGGNTRGNATTVSHWLNTNNSTISTAVTYFDTGMKATVADPLNNVTSYAYASNFVGTYVTQTTMPPTQMPDPGAPTVQHIVSGNYDFNTGLLTSFTDENSQNYSYQYDIMLRLTQANHPDQGETVFTYPNPNTVTRQRLMSGGAWEGVYTANFDGAGRTYETQQVTPSGTVEIDTTYDSLGREATVSNPYYQGTSHSSDPTYGVTQTQYDALSRVLNTTKQDGSVASAAYNDNCTTTTDEAGKQRRVCSDALGRMTEVDEPGDPYSGADASGSLAISGSLQSTQVLQQQGTPGSGSFSITGSERSAQVPHVTCTPPPRIKCTTTYTTAYDTGTISVTVNGFTATVSYNSGSTTSNLASALASALSASGSPVKASASAATITMTATTTGTGTDYSWSSTSATNSGYFSGTSFPVSPTSGALSGGQNAVYNTVYDAGTVTVTAGSFSATVNYSQSGNSTSSQVASALASALNNSSSPVTASASGSTLNLTDKTVGTGGDISVSCSSSTSQGQYFSGPSFTCPSSTTLTGGQNTEGPSLDHNYYVTQYTYDALNNLLSVTQEGDPNETNSSQYRVRNFTYDSLSRLLTATNPESGQITYNYDNDGNLTSKTEPQANQVWGSSQTVTVTYAYDALNRLTGKTYSDGTQNSNYRYDYSSYMGQTFQYPIGRQVAATAANGTISYFTNYDPMGRITQTTQCIPGVTNCQSFSASYDLLGDTLSLTYPSSNFKVTYQYDSAARLVQASDSNGVIYAQNPTILASGAVQEFTSPNFSNNKFHTNLNNRLQPTEIWAGGSQGSSALFDKQYSYNPPNTSLMNNGNIYTVTNVKDGTRTQTFTYDALNRLISAGDGTHWGNTYTYDAWGNLQKVPGSPAGEKYEFAADSNNHLTSQTYDAAGNVINDGGGGTYIFDSENRITSATAGGTTTTYTYDADGRRVKKSSGPNYWYGPGGNALAETDLSGNWTFYIFFGGQRLARNIPQAPPNSPDIKYYVTDHLHSTAMFVDQSGSVLDDNDFYPWGGVVPGVGKTTSTNTVKFTGKYRDSETQLDYFGARYYANISGRWMSPDWAAKPVTVPYANFGDPQSLNLYAYVRNSPIVRVDADGHNYVGMNGFLREDDSGGWAMFQEDHGDSGVDADYDSTTITYTTPGVGSYSVTTRSGPSDGLASAIGHGYTCSGTAGQCGQVKEAIGTIQVAANNLPAESEGRKMLEAVLDFYHNDGPQITFPKDDRGWGGTSTEAGKGTLTISLERTPAELAAELGHEGQHGVDQRANGMPRNRTEEKFGEIRAYKAQGYVNQGLGVSSVYGIWTSTGGWDLQQVYRLSELSTQIWCNGGGNCK